MSSEKERNELSELKAEMVELKVSLNTLSDILSNRINKNELKQRLTLQVFIAQGYSDRKPFDISISGIINSSFSASTVRTAIFLTLLLDLKNRCETKRGLDQPEKSTKQVFAALDSLSSNSEESENKLRVAAYRFFDFCESKGVLHGQKYSLNFDHDNYRLNLVQESADSSEKEKSLEEDLDLEISTNVPEIFRIISKLSGSLTLSQVRSKKVMYVPSGKHGTDLLLLQMYEHQHPLHVTSLYLSPPFASYPPDLLEKIGVSELVKKRKVLAFAGYREKRFLFEEILTLSAIHKLTERDQSGNFICYPGNITKDDVASHLNNLIDILETYENYNLYLTEIQVPFVFVNYEIKSGSAIDNYLVFFQSNEDFSKKDMGCMVMSDPLAWQGVRENIVNWIMEHPSTIKNRKDVIANLKETISSL